jgi:hypothetical protein
MRPPCDPPQPMYMRNRYISQTSGRIYIYITVMVCMEVQYESVFIYYGWAFLPMYISLIFPCIHIYAYISFGWVDAFVIFNPKVDTAFRMLNSLYHCKQFIMLILYF